MYSPNPLSPFHPIDDVNPFQLDSPKPKDPPQEPVGPVQLPQDPITTPAVNSAPVCAENTVEPEESDAVKIAKQEARTERYRLREERGEKDRERREKRHERQHELKMERIKYENEQRERQEMAAMEKANQAHAERMRQMQIAAEEQDKKRRIAQKETNLANIQATVNKLDGLLSRDTKDLEQTKKELEQATKEQKVLQKLIANFDNYKQVELDKVSDDLQLKPALQEFEDADEQIKAAINKTGQIEQNVCKFLTLTHCLLEATRATTSHSNKLDAQIGTFGELVSRECQGKLTVEQYFGDTNLKRFIPILAKGGYLNLHDLRCANDDEYREILEVIEDGIKDEKGDDDEKEEEKEDVDAGRKLLEEWRLGNYWNAMRDDGWEDPVDWQDLSDDQLKRMGFRDGHIKMFKRKLKEHAKSKQLLTTQEDRLLKNICLNHEIWAQDEKDQAATAKEGLNVISPLLSKFFGRIHEEIKHSQLMLNNYETNLNNEQLRAIREINAIPPRSIEYKNADDHDENDDAMCKEWQVGSKCELYSVSRKKWIKGEIINITEDDEVEWLHVKYGNQVKQIGRYSDAIRPAMDANNRLALQSRALTEASIVSIDVTNSMIDEFNESNWANRALAVAIGVEDCCVQIIRSQGTIRESVLLAQAILKMRPAYMSAEAKELWKAVDDGIVRIFKSAINMVRVSAQYFGYFLRFKQSFHFYQSNADKPLLISIQHLRKDVREFTSFQQNFSKTVKELSDEAMNCIRQCVTTSVGASNFEKFRNSREASLKIWLDKKKIFDKKAMDLDHELDQKQKEMINICAEKARLEYKARMLAHSIKSNEEQKTSCIATKSVLNKTII